ncbi:MAG TPA: VOC family protein [Allosphingosinicella sp.]|nr:VOC family protein [Allosphingosinicella sp.]
MATGTLEHVNVTVIDPDRTADMLSRLFGWHRRWEGPAKLGGYTVHVGTDDAYVAVYRYPDGRAPALDSGRLNHIGVVVDDLDAAEARVREAGYQPFNHGAYEPGRRFYFLDTDQVEFEVISYA